jgi:hypothetical protein
MSQRDITMPMQYGGHGELLTESVRAFLHTANPSALVHRTLEGVQAFRKEQIAKGPIDPQDRIVMDRLEFRLRILYQDMQALEDHVYAVPEIEGRVRD